MAVATSLLTMVGLMMTLATLLVAASHWLAVAEDPRIDSVERCCRMPIAAAADIQAAEPLPSAGRRPRIAG